ncbi:MAG: hypothetical protein ABIB47_05470 [Candidatus Woesearchaeota archaeon]
MSRLNLDCTAILTRERGVAKRLEQGIRDWGRFHKMAGTIVKLDTTGKKVLVSTCVPNPVVENVVGRCANRPYAPRIKVHYVN